MHLPECETVYLFIYEFIILLSRLRQQIEMTNRREHDEQTDEGLL